MDATNGVYETPKLQNVPISGSVGPDAQSLQGGRSEAQGSAQPVADACQRAGQAISRTYEQAKNYSTKNPGKAVFIALGMGVGLGLLLSSRPRHSRTGRFARPVVNAISEIALEYFR